MATIVNKIKDKVSHHRSSSSTSNEAARPAAGPSSGGQDDVQQQMTPPRGPTYVSLENSAFHVHRGPNARMSMENHDEKPNLAETGPTTGRDERDPELYAGDVIPKRNSSKRGTTSAVQGSAHTRNISTGKSSLSGVPRSSFDYPQDRSFNATTSGQSAQEVPEDIVPDRTSSRKVDVAGSAMPSSRRRSVVNGTSSSVVEGRPLPPLPHNTNASGTVDHGTTLSSTSANTQRTPDDTYRRNSVARKPLPSTPSQAHVAAGEQENAHTGQTEDLNLSAGLANMYLQQPKSRDAAEFVDKRKALQSGHLTLPEGFDVGDSVRTYVTEEQRPAVTHETIIRERTEIIQEAITRDIHVHHYYTYLQPIKVVEVLPAQHFVLDPETGVKTEIPEPPGWQMPTSMVPTSPDAGMVRGWTRHYLVDEEHPQGIPESPPLKHEHGRENLRAEAIVQQP